jgi:hypothetical protein
MGRFMPRGLEPGESGRLAERVGTHSRSECATLLRRIVLACWLLAATPVILLAQSPDTLRSFYVPTKSFNIPFTLRDVNSASEVHLYVSTDGKSYGYVGAAKPTDGRFHFTAPGDGWYSFVVQTRDASGVLRPADVRDAQPTLRICVDTQRPIISEFRNVGAPDGLPLLQWKVQDTNFREVWAEYRPAGGDWVPLPLLSRQQGEYPWKPSRDLVGEIEVRLQARDQAGNTSEPRTIRLVLSEAVSSMSPPPEPNGSIPIMHVKSRTFELTYGLENTGPSGVRRVTIWKMRPGFAWQKCTEFGDGNKSSVAVAVPTSGRWGFRLIPQNGVGLAEPDPRPGDPPDIWVEVDESKPQVSVTNVTVSSPAEGGYLTVYWKASDTFLSATPITLWYATAPQGSPWIKILDNLPNTGSWSEQVELFKKRIENRFEFYLKVTADDEAGNRGEAQWRDIVKIDLQIPRIKIKLHPKEAAAGDGGQLNRVPPYEPLQAPSPPAGESPIGEGLPKEKAPARPGTPGNGQRTKFNNPLD